MALQDIGQQLFVAMEFKPIPAVERGHNGEHVGIQRCVVALTMLFEQALKIHGYLALIYTSVGAAIANKVLGCTDHFF